MPEGKFPQTCSKCGYTWKAQKGHPKECPECKSRKWNIKSTMEKG